MYNFPGTAFIESCQIKKPDFTQCSTRSVQELFSKLDTLPGFEAIKSFDPFYLDRIDINEGGADSVNIKVKLNNIKVNGVLATKVKESKVSSKDYSWKTTVEYPKLKLESDYNLQGRILLLQLNGKGKMKMEMGNVAMVAYTKTKLYEKGGFTFYNVTSVKADYKMGSFKCHLTNLFNGNTQLEDSTNDFLNENWELLSEALRPVITQTLNDLLLDIFSKVFHYLPANFLISDIPTSKELYGTAKN